MRMGNGPSSTRNRVRTDALPCIEFYLESQTRPHSSLVVIPMLMPMPIPNPTPFMLSHGIDCIGMAIGVDTGTDCIGIDTGTGAEAGSGTDTGTGTGVDTDISSHP